MSMLQIVKTNMLNMNVLALEPPLLNSAWHSKVVLSYFKFERYEK